MTSTQFAVQGSTALITGANRGIGKAIAEQFARAGATKIYAGARDPEALKPLVEQFGGRIVPIKLDVTKQPDIDDAAARATDVDLLVNNAGVAGFTSGMEEDGLNNARTEMEVNYFGVLNMVRAFAPVLKGNGGGVMVNIGSIVSMINIPMINTYSASKAAVWSLSQGLRVALAEQGTRVMTVHPGPIDTDMGAEVDMEKAPPSAVADAIIAALADGTDEIPTDETSRAMYDQWRIDPRAAQEQASGMAV